MEFHQSVRAVDAHAGGQPVRIIQKAFSQQSPHELLKLPEGAPCDERTHLLMVEPRGHQDMNGCLVFDPVHPDSDISALFMNHAAVRSFSGHALIGLVTALVETGQLENWSPNRPILVDTPLGTIAARVKMDGSEVTRVTYEAPPAFVHTENVPVRGGSVNTQCDIAFGGRFYAIVGADAFGVRVNKDDIPKLVALEAAIRTQLNQQVDVRHPLHPEIHGVQGVIFVESDVEENRLRSVTVADGLVNRSPGGTSTAAILAQRYQHERADIGDWFRNESITGGCFEGMVTGHTQVGNYAAITADISGTGFVLGLMQFVVDPTDPLATGFLLR